MCRTNKGLTFIGMVVLVVIAFTAVVFLLPGVVGTRFNAGEAICKANLSQFGKGYAIYLLDIGKQVLYPEKNGQGFVVALYNNKILVEPEVYCCPSTEDYVPAANILSNLPDEEDAEGPVSYAGRKNADQTFYPGIFKLDQDVTTTPIVSDDIGKSYNHKENEVINFLFLDGNVDHASKNSKKFDIPALLDVLAN